MKRGRPRGCTAGASPERKRAWIGPQENDFKNVEVGLESFSVTCVVQLAWILSLGVQDYVASLLGGDGWWRVT